MYTDRPDRQPFGRLVILREPPTRSTICSPMTFCSRTVPSRTWMIRTPRRRWTMRTREKSRIWTRRWISSPYRMSFRACCWTHSSRWRTLCNRPDTRNKLEGVRQRTNGCLFMMKYHFRALAHSNWSPSVMLASRQVVPRAVYFPVDTLATCNLTGLPRDRCSPCHDHTCTAADRLFCAS